MPLVRSPAARRRPGSGPRLCLALALALGLASLPARAQGPVQLAGPADDPVVARIDGAPVHMSELAEFARGLPPEFQQMPQPVLFPLLLEQVIAQRLLVEAARKANLQASEEVRRRVARAEAEALQAAYLTRELGGLVTEQNLRARYQRDVADQPPQTEVRASHILVATETDARAVITALQGGADFAALARERSRDPGARNGGDLGFFKRDDMVPEFATVAFALPPGQTTTEPVRTQFGWHVIRVTERRDLPRPTFEQAREQLARAISDEAIGSLIDRLRAAARVERVPLEGQGGRPAGGPALMPAPGAAPAPSR